MIKIFLGLVVKLEPWEPFRQFFYVLDASEAGHALQARHSKACFPASSEAGKQL